MTYGELDQAANQVARWAQSRGLRRHEVVALQMENRPELVVPAAGSADRRAWTPLRRPDPRPHDVRHGETL